MPHVASKWRVGDYYASFVARCPIFCGMPKGKDKRGKPLGVRWKPEQRDLINQAAELLDLRPTDIIRIGTLNYARSTIKNKSLPGEPTK